ncbi:NVEALA domain-containing protein [Parabacteroides provencensis]|uniref:NVEALA domain-containing protein n=1 Tax=Parabacteroides provencensis TaxID=1944636 RepID=UPI0021D3A642|nr:NVEALA domain-containing protein [Parabacteroides provencensis]
MLGIAIMVAIAVTTSWNISQSKNNAKLLDLALENVEALANCEAGYGGTCWLSYLYPNPCCNGGELGCSPCGH